MTAKSLFKYGKLNAYSEEVFSTPTVWFSRPAELNDPFECRPWFTFDGTKEQIASIIANTLSKQRPELTHDSAIAQAFLLIDGRHRDPLIWEAIRRDIIATLGQKIGLYCLSQNNDSVLMWSHYAENHQGYCLEFGTTEHNSFFGAAQRVNYRVDYPVVDIFNKSYEEQADLIFYTKFVGWSYEEEWRIINHKTGPGISEYPPELLRGVVFGQRMLEAERTKIRGWVNKRGHAVKFYEAQSHDRQFKVVVNKIG